MRIVVGTGTAARTTGPATASTRAVSTVVRANHDTQSKLRDAAHDPAGADESAGRLQPDDPVEAAGTRPDPAVSVPSADGRPLPVATATAEPELEPPEMCSGSTALRHMP